MIRKLKALGIALGAVLALGAVVASSASAVDLFTTSKAPAVITGSGRGTLIMTKADGGHFMTIHCETSKLSGTVTSSGAKEVTAFLTFFGTELEPSNKECASSIGNAKFDMNGCDYDLTGETTKEDPADKTGKKDAVVSITCPTGKEIQITAPASCTISIPSETPTEGGVIYTNGEELVGGVKVKDVTITATVTGITFTSTAACQLIGIPKEGNNFDYIGTITTTCWEDKGKGTNEHEFVEGAACNLEVS